MGTVWLASFGINITINVILMPSSAQVVAILQAQSIQHHATMHFVPILVNLFP